MKYSVNDIAYMSDIDALNKKIVQIEENSHTNDENIAKIMNTYPTVDETNTALDVLKGRIEILEAENTALKATIAAFEARIAALEPRGPTLPDFYQGFTYHEVGENDFIDILDRGGVSFISIYVLLRIMMILNMLEYLMIIMMSNIMSDPNMI